MFLFCNGDGEWFRAGGDNSTFYTAIENCDSTRVYAVSDIVYNYNDAIPLNDYKVNKEEQDKTVSQILGTHIQTKKMKRILIAIPTNRNIEAQTFKSIYDLIIPDGYQVEFQYFYGYSRSQIKNLIGKWAERYDYTVFVPKKGTVASNLICDMVDALSDIVTVENHPIFGVKKEVFLKMQYPHFTPGNSELEEVQQFIKLAMTYGASVTYLNNYYSA